jgi:hypothetical protein
MNDLADCSFDFVSKPGESNNDKKIEFATKDYKMRGGRGNK